ncbi:MAG: Com family DNA-binding transcriptional regulator [Deltaproteobacteria bacterium]|nr:MAG: Com family DNA-binding transcriptional regulator [Deltaproteobacteria bacterium]
MKINIDLSVARDDEVRCACGRLLARRAGAGVELKCPRCRRTAVVTLEDLRDAPREVRLRPSPRRPPTE